MIVYDELVAPGMSTPFRCHCNAGAGIPLAEAVNVTESPAVTAWGTGSRTMVGAIFTVSTAPFVVADPAALVAIIQ